MSVCMYIYIYMWKVHLLQQLTIGILATAQITIPWRWFHSAKVWNLEEHTVETNGQHPWSVKQPWHRSGLAPAQDLHLHHQLQQHEELGQGVGCCDEKMPCSSPSWHLSPWSCPSSQTWDWPGNCLEEPIYRSEDLDTTISKFTIFFAWLKPIRMFIYSL